MTKPKTPTPDDTVPATAPEPAKPIAAPAENTPPVTEGGEMTADAPEMDPISSRQEDFEIVYADWAGTTPDQIAGLRMMNGSYENPKVSHCWHFYQLGSGGLEIERE